MRIIPLISLCFCIGCITACSPSSAAVKQKQAFGDKHVQSSQLSIPPPHNNVKLVALRAESDVELNVASTPVSGSCSISILQTDSLLMTFQGPFGVLVGKLSACPEYMKYFDALNTELLEGDPQSQELANRMPIPLTYNDIIHLMRCEVPYEPALYTLMKTKDDGTSVILVYSVDERFVDLVKLSSVDSTILTYQRKSRKDELLLNVNYSNYSVTNGVRFPKAITLDFPLRNMTAKFVVTDLIINPVGEHYSFNVPKGIKRTKLE